MILYGMLHNISSTSIATWARMYSRAVIMVFGQKAQNHESSKQLEIGTKTVPNYILNSVIAVFFYRQQPISTDQISKMHEKSHALTLLSKLCQSRGLPKLPKASLTHITERQTGAGGTTIASYIMLELVPSLQITYYCPVFLL